MENKEELARFKHLTEYFVAHLEYLANGSQPTSIGYKEYIMPWVEKKTFKSSGQGWNGQSIQTQVSEWDHYSNGQICINVYGANYKSRGTYLNWKGTGANIMVEWNGTHVGSLILVDYDTDLEEWHPKGIQFSLKELNMFDGQLPNEQYKSLFDEYNKMIEAINNNKRIHVLGKYIQLLKANKNLILTGAPGTGKTFMAKEIAKAMGCEDDEIGFVQFHPSYDYTDFVEGLRPIGESSEIGFKRQDGAFKEFCKRSLCISSAVKTPFDIAFDSLFHDIREGLTVTIPLKSGKESTRLSTSGRDMIKWEAPNTGNTSTNTVSRERLRNLYREYNTMEELSEMGNINDSIRDVIGGCNTSMYYAVLQEIIKRISELPRTTNEQFKNNKSIVRSKRDYVFIIDEINRGEISKIFGELFFSIDPGYRGEAGRVQTQYQNMVEDDDVFKDGFFVPENVYIIGTMNDIDRSVESMDFAMRRRFAWQEVTAEESYANMIENESEFADAKDEIRARMFSLNKAIAETEGLDEAYQIGAAYFRKYLDYRDRENPFDCLWENHLKGLLFEYLRGNRRAKELLEKLHEAYNKTSIDE